MAILETLSPVATVVGDVKQTALAPRPSTLGGKTVGLIWNGKRGGEVALHRIAELLQERTKDIQVIHYRGNWAGGNPRDLLDRAFRECDVFVGSTGD